MSNKFALLIGSREFEDPSLEGLSAPWEDVESLGAVLAEFGGFTVDKQADLNMDDIRAKIGAHFKKAGPDDTVLLYYTGHGLRDTHSHDLYLALRRTQTDLISATSLEARFIREQMQRSLSKQQILIYDCCHAGAAMADGQKRQKGAATLSESDVLDQGGNGTYVLASSAAEESSYERGGKSIYTEFMVEALRTGAAAPDKTDLTVDELHNYLVRRVSADSVSMRPQIWKTGGAPIVIARNPDPRKPIPKELDEALFGSDALRTLGAITKLAALRDGSDSRLTHDIEALFDRRLAKTDDLLASVAEAIKDTRRSTPLALQITNMEKQLEAEQKKSQESTQRLTEFATENASLAKHNAELQKANAYLKNKKAWTPYLVPATLLVAAFGTAAFYQQIVGPLIENTHSGPVPLSKLQSNCTGCPDMIVIPGGTFTMGSPDGVGDTDERPQTEVTIAAFALAETEVTFRQWQACVDGGGCKSNPWPSDQEWMGTDRPVINISWEHAMEYIAWLNQQVEEGDPYRLPSEAEWEYAARATRDKDVPGPPIFSAGDISIRASTTAYPWGWDWDASFANGDRSVGKTSPVKRYPVNGFGLHDMHGNVWEWTSDCWHSTLDGISKDGLGWDSEGDCSGRVVRGGSWENHPQNLRSADRDWSEPNNRIISLGFRPARTLLPLSP